jgi:hypothetical protein
MWRHSTTIIVVAFTVAGCAAARKSSHAVSTATAVVAPVKSVGDIGPFRAIRPVGDRVYLAAAEPTANLAFALSLNGQPWSDHCEARVGDVVHTGIPDALGAGACWYDILEVTRDAVVLRENTWFYDIVPETHEVVRVRPYGDAR